LNEREHPLDNHDSDEHQHRIGNDANVACFYSVIDYPADELRDQQGQAADDEKESVAENNQLPVGT